MKVRNQYLLSLLLLLTCVYSIEITDQQLSSFPYGPNEFQFLSMGDTGTGSVVKKIMSKSNFDLLIHLGDFDYNKKPDQYFEEIYRSNKYKFMAVMGNHEGESEVGKSGVSRYLKNIKYTMSNSGSECQYYESGWMWSCKFQNMRVIGLSAGVSGAPDRSEQLRVLKSELSKATEDWIVCAWHMYDKYYHTGKYESDYNKNVLSDDGESFYDVCKEYGAIILSAHDHVYARTKVLSKFKTPVVDTFDSKTPENIIQIRKGATFNILNGAGGYEMYDENMRYTDHWETRYSKGDHGENEDKFGGLFCKMNVGGNKDKAHCAFVRVNSQKEIFDEFTIYKNQDPSVQTYQAIDENFRAKKIEEYKIANNIVDPVITTSNTTDNGNSIDLNNNIEVIDDDKIENEEGDPINKTIIIVSSSSLFAFAAGVAIFVSRKRKNSLTNKLDTFYKENDEYNENKNSTYDNDFTKFDTGLLPVYNTNTNDYKKEKNTLGEEIFGNTNYNFNNYDFNYSTSYGESNNNNLENNQYNYNNDYFYSNTSNKAYTSPKALYTSPKPTNFQKSPENKSCKPDVTLDYYSRANTSRDNIEKDRIENNEARIRSRNRSKSRTRENDKANTSFSSNRSNRDRYNDNPRSNREHDYENKEPRTPRSYRERDYENKEVSAPRTPRSYREHDNENKEVSSPRTPRSYRERDNENKEVSSPRTPRSYRERDNENREPRTPRSYRERDDEPRNYRDRRDKSMDSPRTHNDRRDKSMDSPRTYREQRDREQHDRENISSTKKTNQEYNDRSTSSNTRTYREMRSRANDDDRRRYRENRSRSNSINKRPYRNRIDQSKYDYNNLKKVNDFKL